MTDALVLRLDAPLQSWGLGSRGSVKDSLDEPTFSGVVGVIANAQGRVRGDDLSDLAGLWFGTRVDRAGERISDFYTAGTVDGIAARKEEVGKDGSRTFKNVVKDEGVIGYKEYLSGACFTVVLAGTREVIDQVGTGLDAPARVLFLGRKACPITRPLVVERVLDCESPESLLQGFPLARDNGNEQPLGAKCKSKREGKSKDEDERADRLRITVPSTPADPHAIARFDHPLDFTSGHREYLPRYVRTKMVPAPDLKAVTP